MTIANRISIARILLIPLNVAFLLWGLYGLAALFFLLLSSSDAIDGFVARRFNQVSDLGKFLDPLADKIFIIVILVALVGLQKAGSVPVMLLVAREFIVSGIRVSAAKAGESLPASAMAKWKTVLQIIATFMLILNLPLANFMLWTAVVLALVSGGSYLWKSMPYFSQMK